MAQIDLNIKYTVNLSYNYIKALIWSNTSDLPLVYSCIKKSVFHVKFFVKNWRMQLKILLLKRNINITIKQ
nr:MAG TPA: hypothetical protein [Bacteriophage sp.]